VSRVSFSGIATTYNGQCLYRQVVRGYDWVKCGFQCSSVLLSRLCFSFMSLSLLDYGSSSARAASAFD
jgi:hypothetical protein